MRILIVEDDQRLRKIIKEILIDENYEVDEASDGSEGLIWSESNTYDLFIFDIMLPELDGISLLRQIRKTENHTPALFLTAKDSVQDKVEGLDAGADDYLVKPFASQELLARIRSLLRRAGKIGMEGKLSCGPFLVDNNRHQGFACGNMLNLTSKEFELLHFFIQNKDQILTRDQIYERVWGLDSDTIDTIVDLYVHYLRKKFDPYDCAKYVKTVRGIGYMLKMD